MKKLAALLTAFLMVLTFNTPILAEDASNQKKSITLSVESVSGNPGEIVTVPIELSAEDGINGISFTLIFDTDLEFQPFAQATDLGDFELTMFEVLKNHDYEGQLGCYAIGALDSDSIQGTGSLFNLRFLIKKDAAPGKKSISILVDKSSDYTLGANSVVSSVECTGKDGFVTVNGPDSPDDTPNEDSSNDNNDNDNNNNSNSNSNNNSSTGPSKPNSDNSSIVVPVAPDATPTPTPTAPPETESGKPEDNDSSIEDDPILSALGINFTDLKGYEWARDHIVNLAFMQVIKGTSNTTFSPAENVTRADFILMLSRLLKFDVVGEDNFDDVPADAYYADALSAAKKLGIAKGFDNKFSPLESITRQDLISLVYRALLDQNILTENTVIDENVLNNFKDTASISDYAVQAIQTMVSLKIIQGSDGMINPLSNATRAETAVIMDNINKYIQQQKS